MTHEIYMNRAINLAKKGSGNTSPNPLVGSVLVFDNQIIGEGYHRVFGGPHAEVNSISSVKDKSLLSKCTLYVTLEPCSHYGKTPPCAELIVKSKIPKVVICNLDPHDKVAGKGIELLRQNGIEVIQGVLEKEGNNLNKRFFTYHRKRRPYIILKWAQNQHGLMDKERNSNKHGINWITSKEVKSITHSWRGQEDAILVGANTVLNDSPTLTTRHSSGKNPLRLVIDLNSNIPLDHTFWNTQTPTVSYAYVEKRINTQTETVVLNHGEDILEQILQDLHRRQVHSLFVEGGKRTIEEFIKADLWDEARILTGVNSWESGLEAPVLSGQLDRTVKLGNNQIQILFNK